jgi:membrane-associated phospholipid phosphatase
MSTDRLVEAGEAAPRTRKEILAKVITEVTSPVPVAGAVLVAEGVRTSPGLSGLGYGLLAAVFSCLLPLAAVLAMVRTRRVTDHHLGVRSQRALPLSIGIACTATGVVLLAASGAPSELVRVTVSMLAGLVVALVVNLYWKASVHTAVMTGSVILLATLSGPLWLIAGALIPVTAWSRVICRAHTPAETLGGAVFGGVTCVVMLHLLLP